MTPKICSCCKGKGRTPTDLWDLTAALWEPYIICYPEKYKEFHQMENDEDCVNFFDGKLDEHYHYHGQ